MQQLYPNIKPYNIHRVNVDDGHELYVEESGDVDGIPVLVVHGGPGAGCHSDQRRFFDPSKYRIILFDQRGCGQSTPHGELDNNNTQALIEDIECIRKTLDIKKLILFGGSWGSTLCLLYAQAYPNHVEAMMLRSILLANQADYDWFFVNGANRIFPEAWKEFSSKVPKGEHERLIEVYNDMLNDDNELNRMATAKAWSKWHRTCSTLSPISNNSQQPSSLRLARMECHYCVNKFFIEENQILKNMFPIRNIPGVIIHGRYDMICTLSNAYELHERWPRSDLEIVREAGHASSEIGLTDALIRATDRYAKNLSIS
tara:strand:- start:161666 stop:162610 length:945 start_codon:yes stop_codon:yes gene_type:complete